MAETKTSRISGWLKNTIYSSDTYFNWGCRYFVNVLTVAGAIRDLIVDMIYSVASMPLIRY
ncbi:hypothetical protein CAP48_00370 [Advenella sp. S44]|nr:hypothetical protein CAP48_00370 [Advenella sp. S44]